jgi:hypothetical protein
VGWSEGGGTGGGVGEVLKYDRVRTGRGRRVNWVFAMSPFFGPRKRDF